MSDGLSTANADAALDTWTADADYIQLHTGDPGSSFTSNVSSVTTREAVTWGSPSGGEIESSDEPEWADWAGDNGEVLTDISAWDEASSGTGQFSIPLSADVTMDTGDSLALPLITISVPTAA